MGRLCSLVMQRSSRSKKNNFPREMEATIMAQISSFLPPQIQTFNRVIPVLAVKTRNSSQQRIRFRGFPLEIKVNSKSRVNFYSLNPTPTMETSGMLGHFLMKPSYHDKGQLASFLSFNDKWGQVFTGFEFFQGTLK